MIKLFIFSWGYAGVTLQVLLATKKPAEAGSGWKMLMLRIYRCVLLPEFAALNRLVGSHGI